MRYLMKEDLLRQQQNGSYCVRAKQFLFLPHFALVLRIHDWVDGTVEGLGKLPRVGEYSDHAEFCRRVGVLQQLQLFGLRSRLRAPNLKMVDSLLNLTLFFPWRFSRLPVRKIGRRVGGDWDQFQAEAALPRSRCPVAIYCKRSSWPSGLHCPRYSPLKQQQQQQQ